MKASKFNLKAFFVISVLILGFSSCEKDDKLEAPESINNRDVRSQQWTTVLGDTLNRTANRLESLPLEGMYQKKVYQRVNTVQTYMYGSQTQNYFEWFEAEGNHVANRPLIILAPGGGWQQYNEVPKLQELARDLALRGYPVALVRYFMDPNVNPPSFDEQHKSVRDIRSAVRYFKLNAAKYYIDPENIFIGGWSTGATISMAAAYIENEIELLEIAEQPIRDGLLASINNLGYDSNDNLGPNNEVRGVLGMFTYMMQKTFIDAGEPSLMMINHANAHFQDGTNIIGKAAVGGGTVYGTDTLNGRALDEGYVQGQDLEYIRMTGSYLYKGSNETCLWDGHWDAIADFFYRNIKQ